MIDHRSQSTILPPQRGMMGVLCLVMAWLALSVMASPTWAQGKGGVKPPKSSTLELITREPGAPDAPNPLRFRLLLADPGELPTGIAPKNVQVHVLPKGMATNAKEAQAFLGKGIFLKRFRHELQVDVRQPAVHKASGLYDLVLTISDGKRPKTYRLNQSVYYSDQLTDVVLCIDASASMKKTDPQEMRIAAAKGFIDMAAKSRRISNIGIVRFTGNVRTLAELTPVDDTKTLYKALSDLKPSGRTNIDEALLRAESILRNSQAQRQVVILLTDGKQEPPPYEDAHRRLAWRNVPVYTIGLSKEADATLLNRIALDTGGDYYNSPTQHELFAIFQAIGVSLQDLPLLVLNDHTIPTGETQAGTIHVDPTVARAEFFATSQSRLFDFVLTTPTNRKIQYGTQSKGNLGIVESATSRLYRWTKPPLGLWNYTLTKNSDRSADRRSGDRGRTIGSYRVRVSGDTPLYPYAFARKGDYQRLEPVSLGISLANGGQAMTDATVEAIVIGPDKRTHTLTLLDDGKQTDTFAGDAVYSGRFTDTKLPGNYHAVIRVTGKMAGTGKDGEAVTYQRALTQSFWVGESTYIGLNIVQTVLDFGELRPGQFGHRQLTAELHHSKAMSLTLKASGISAKGGTLEYPRAFDVKKTSQIGVRVMVPEDAKTGDYKGLLTLTSAVHQKSLPIRFSVVRPQLSFKSKALNVGAIGRGTQIPGSLDISLSGNVQASESISVKLAPFRDSKSQVVKGLTMTAPKDVELKDGKAKLAFTVTTPDVMPSGKITGQLTFTGKGYRKVLPIHAQAFAGKLIATPAKLDSGMLQRLPSEVSLQTTITGTLYGKHEPFTLRAVAKAPTALPKKHHWIKPEWIRIKHPSRIGDKGITNNIHIALPGDAPEGRFYTELVARSANAQLVIPVTAYVQPVTERFTVEVLPTQVPTQTMYRLQQASMTLNVKSLLPYKQSVSIDVVGRTELDVVIPQNSFELEAGAERSFTLRMHTPAGLVPGEQALRIRVKGLGKPVLVHVPVLVQALPDSDHQVLPKDLGISPVLIRAVLQILLAIIVMVLFIWWIRAQKRGSMTKYIAVSSAVHIFVIYLVVTAVRDIQQLPSPGPKKMVKVKMVKAPDRLGGGQAQQEQRLLSQEKISSKTFETIKQSVEIRERSIDKRQHTVESRTRRSVSLSKVSPKDPGVTESRNRKRPSRREVNFEPTVTALPQVVVDAAQQEAVQQPAQKTAETTPIPTVSVNAGAVSRRDDSAAEVAVDLAPRRQVANTSRRGGSPAAQSDTLAAVAPTRSAPVSRRSTASEQRREMTPVTSEVALAIPVEQVEAPNPAPAQGETLEAASLGLAASGQTRHESAVGADIGVERRGKTLETAGTFRTLSLVATRHRNPEPEARESGSESRTPSRLDTPHSLNTLMETDVESFLSSRADWTVETPIFEALAPIGRFDIPDAGDLRLGPVHSPITRGAAVPVELEQAVTPLAQPNFDEMMPIDDLAEIARAREASPTERARMADEIKSYSQVCVVSSIQGGVQLIRGGKRLAPQQGTIVNVNDRFVVPEGGKLIMRLGGSAKVVVAGGSDVELTHLYVSAGVNRLFANCHISQGKVLMVRQTEGTKLEATFDRGLWVETGLGESILMSRDKQVHILNRGSQAFVQQARGRRQLLAPQRAMTFDARGISDTRLMGQRDYTLFRQLRQP